MGEKLSVNPWLDIWIRPRETIRAIVKFNPAYLFYLLAAIYGFPTGLQFAVNLALGERFPLWSIAAGAVILSVGIGYIGLSIISGFLFWTGQWIGARGSYRNIRAAVAWSNVPTLVNVVIWILMMGMFGVGLFMRGFDNTAIVGPQAGVVFIAMIAQTVTAVWSFIILLKALGEVQGFSAWKALLNVLIPTFMVAIGAWLVMSLVFFAMSLLQ
jgi:hypothetical protein